MSTSRANLREKGLKDAHEVRDYRDYASVITGGRKSNRSIPHPSRWAPLVIYTFRGRFSEKNLKDFFRLRCGFLTLSRVGLRIVPGSEKSPENSYIPWHLDTYNDTYSWEMGRLYLASYFYETVQEHALTGVGKECPEDLALQAHLQRRKLQEGLYIIPCSTLHPAFLFLIKIKPLEEISLPAKFRTIPWTVGALGRWGLEYVDCNCCSFTLCRQQASPLTSHNSLQLLRVCSVYTKNYFLFWGRVLKTIYEDAILFTWPFNAIFLFLLIDLWHAEF